MQAENRSKQLASVPASLREDEWTLTSKAPPVTGASKIMSVGCCPYIDWRRDMGKATELVAA